MRSASDLQVAPPAPRVQVGAGVEEHLVLEVDDGEVAVVLTRGRVGARDVPTPLHAPRVLAAGTTCDALNGLGVHVVRRSTAHAFQQAAGVGLEPQDHPQPAHQVQLTPAPKHREVGRRGVSS